VIVNREGTLHIVDVSKGTTVPPPPGVRVYHVGFADYASPGGAMKMKRIVGEQGLRDFFTSIGVQPNIAESAINGLRIQGDASILRVVLPENMLIDLGLQDKKGTTTGKEKIEASITFLRNQGHAVDAVVSADGSIGFNVDRRMLISWKQMEDLADGVYSLADLEREYRRRQSTQSLGTLEIRRSVSGRGYIAFHWPNATDSPQSEAFEEKGELLAYLRKFKLRDFSPEQAVQQLEYSKTFRVMTIEDQ